MPDNNGVPQPVPFVTLANSLAVNEIANLMHDWRKNKVNNYETLIAIERIVKEYREDLV